MTPSSCALRAAPERADTQHVRARVSTRLPRATWRLAHTAAPHACMRECVFETYRRSSAVIELCAEEESARSCSVLCAQPRAAGALGRSGATSVRLVCTGAKRGIALILRSLDALCVAFRASLVARSAAPLWPLEQTARAGQTRHARCDMARLERADTARCGVLHGRHGACTRVALAIAPRRTTRGGVRRAACRKNDPRKTHSLPRKLMCKTWYAVNLAPFLNPLPGSRSRTFAVQNLYWRLWSNLQTRFYNKNFVRCMSKVRFFATAC